MRFLRQSTSVDEAIGPFLDETDGKTAETGLTITQADIRLKKNGGAWAQKAAAQTLTHEEAGWYEVTLDATDTDTVGHLTVAIHESGALPVWVEYTVLEETIYDALFAASANAFSGAAGSTQLTALTDGSITAAKIGADAITAAKIADGAIDAATFAAGAINAAAIANNAIDAATFAADVDAEILSYLVDDATRIDASQLNTNLDAAVSTRASQASLNTVDDFLDTEIAAILGFVDTEVAAILALLDDARTEPAQGAPPVNPDMATKVDYLYKAWRNKKDNDGATTNLYNDDGSTIGHKQTTTELAGTVTKGEWITGA